jgi:hypothetical protein
MKAGCIVDALDIDGSGSNILEGAAKLTKLVGVIALIAVTVLVRTETTHNIPP